MKPHELRIMSKAELDHLIDQVILVKHKYPGSPDIYPFEFCPNCGCTKVNFYDHGAPYPEVWIEETCARCGKWVAGADNSRWGHILEDVISERENDQIQRPVN